MFHVGTEQLRNVRWLSCARTAAWSVWWTLFSKRTLELGGQVCSLPTAILGRPRLFQFPHHLLTKAVDRALARKRDQRDLARLAWLEAHRRAGRDIEPHAARLLAVEFQRRIGLEEMVVRADLDRPVAGIGDRDLGGLAAGVELDLAILDEQFAGDHGGKGLFIPRLRLSRWILEGAASSVCSLPRLRGRGGERVGAEQS